MSDWYVVYDDGSTHDTYYADIDRDRMVSFVLNTPSGPAVIGTEGRDNSKFFYRRRTRISSDSSKSVAFVVGWMGGRTYAVVGGEFVEVDLDEVGGAPVAVPGEPWGG